MKKILCSLLTLIVFFITGCVAQVKNPEIINNTYVSTHPAVNISVRPRFEYLGKIEIYKLPVKGDGYLFGVVKDGKVEEAVIMLTRSLFDSGYIWSSGRPPGFKHTKIAGYDWVMGISR